MNLRSIIFYLGFVFFVCLFSIEIQAQELMGSRDKAEKLFNEFQYSRAAVIYQKFTDVPVPNLNDMERLAICFEKMNKYEDAEIWYARIVKDPKSSLENLLHYGEILKTNARYTEAKKIFQRYLSKAANNKRALVSLAGCDSALIWIANPTNHAIKNERNINTEESEFSVFPINNRQIYYTGEPVLTKAKDKYGWTGNSFLRVFSANRLPDNSLRAPSIAEGGFNNEAYHVGPISTNKEQDILFITRTYPGKNGVLSRINGNKYHTQNMELYIQAKIYGKWRSDPFAYNNVEQYSVGHAVLSKDENTLYFVSDMPNGFGGTDIWYCEIQPDGSWGSCKNAGKEINTAGDELFPTIGPNGMLYYSSNGLPGMGGLDIFCSNGSRAKWSTPVNMRYPLNSPGDDFSFIISEDQRNGYLSSNRKNGVGGDDIYSFLYKKPGCSMTIMGTVFDKKTGLRLPESEVTLYSLNYTIVARQESKPDGTFLFKLDKSDAFKLHGTKTSFYPDSLGIKVKDPNVNNLVKVALYLEPLYEKGKTFRLKNILYNFDKDNIRKDAAKILDELVTILHENPTLKIELASHTDCRGKDTYNEDLSQRRAQSCVDYIVSRGIERERMVAKGYGESRLINKCSDGVSCSEAAHQENRRTEFTILSY